MKLSKYLPRFGVKPYVITVDPQWATYPLIDESLNEEVTNEVSVVRTKNRELFSFYKKSSWPQGGSFFRGFANESHKPGPRQKVARFYTGQLLLTRCT
ncbi:MAG: hypothetical protein U5L96_02270 [Owenweeksia sp.]|nr:hypothetical protein [Owenweeksia sp.]